MYDEKPSKKSLQDVRHVIAVLGGKGGVGKSTVTVNLALALKKQGKRVGILDADVYGPSIRQLLGDETFPTRAGDQIAPGVTKGIRVISTAFFDSKQLSSVVRAPIANQIIEQFLSQISWGELDVLLVDFPPGTGDIQITLMQKARLSGAVIVTTPQEVALLDVRKSIEMCQLMEVPVLGVVENMSFFIHDQERYALFGEGGGKWLANEFDIPLLGQIPIDPEISRTGDEGRSLFETKGVSRGHFEEVAKRLQKRLLKGREREMQEWEWKT